MAFGWDIDDDDDIYDDDEMDEEDNEHPFGEDEDLNDEHSAGKREDVSAQEAADEEEREMSQHHSGSGVNLDYKGGLGDPTEDAKMEREREAMLDSYRNKNTRVDDDVIDGDKKGKKGKDDKGKKDKPNDKQMMTEAGMKEKFPLKSKLICPSCKQKSLFADRPDTLINLFRPPVGAIFRFFKDRAIIRYYCFNPKCKHYYVKHPEIYFYRSQTDYVHMGTNRVKPKK